MQNLNNFQNFRSFYQQQVPLQQPQLTNNSINPLMNLNSNHQFQNQLNQKAPQGGKFGMIKQNQVSKTNKKSSGTFLQKLCSADVKSTYMEAIESKLQLNKSSESQKPVLSMQQVSPVKMGERYEDEQKKYVEQHIRFMQEILENCDQKSSKTCTNSTSTISNHISNDIALVNERKQNSSKLYAKILKDNMAFNQMCSNSSSNESSTPTFNKDEKIDDEEYTQNQLVQGQQQQSCATHQASSSHIVTHGSISSNETPKSSYKIDLSDAATLQQKKASKMGRREKGIEKSKVDLENGKYAQELQKVEELDQQIEDLENNDGSQEELEQLRKERFKLNNKITSAKMRFEKTKQKAYISELLNGIYYDIMTPQQRELAKLKEREIFQHDFKESLFNRKG